MFGTFFCRGPIKRFSPPVPPTLLGASVRGRLRLCISGHEGYAVLGRHGNGQRRFSGPRGAQQQYSRRPLSVEIAAPSFSPFNPFGLSIVSGVAFGLGIPRHLVSEELQEGDNKGGGRCFFHRSRFCSLRSRHEDTKL